MLSAAVQSVFASSTGTVDPKINSTPIVSFRASQFTLAGGSTLVGLRVSPASGSLLNPAAVSLFNAKGKAISAVASGDDAAGTKDSYGVFDLASGGYSVKIPVQGSTSGAYRIDAYLVGDLNGDRKVNSTDDAALTTLINAGKYSAVADANLDGKVNAADRTLLRGNLGDSTTLNPTTAGGLAALADTYSFNERGTLVVPSLGILKNDFVAGFLDVLTIQADAKSAHGANVIVNADGGFSWDEKGSTELATLAPGKSVADTFNYKLTNAAGVSSAASVTVKFTAPLTVDDELYDTTEDAKLVVPANKGLLINDGDPANPKKLTVIDADTTTAFGAKVTVLSDGSFVYDPTTSPKLAALKEGEIADDSFKYVINGVVVGHANIGVHGKADGAEDVFETNANTPISIPAKGILANDGSGATISSFQATTKYGVQISVKSDGSFSYDGTHVLEFQSLSSAETEYDRFDYSYKVGGKTKTATVTIAVQGVNDAPTPLKDSFEVAQDTVLAPSQSLLFNDSDPDDRARLYVSSYETLSELGAAVLIRSNGRLTYDPRNAELLQLLSRNETLTDTFSYTVSDGHGQSATAVVHITVKGIDHGVTAVTDKYQVYETHELSGNADTGLFTNDVNPDKTDKLHLVSFDAKSKNGATIEVFDDGSFDYDPSTSNALNALHEGDTLLDTFTYTVTDNHGHTSRATVKVTVVGETHEPDDLYVAYTGQVLSVDAEGGVLANDPLHLGHLTDAPTTTKLGATLVLNSDGSFTYDPSTIPASVLAAAANPYFGNTSIDSFTYTATDEAGTKTETHTVSLRVTAPTAETLATQAQIASGVAPARSRAAAAAAITSAAAAPSVPFYYNGNQPTASIVNNVLVLNAPWNSWLGGAVGTQMELVADTPNTIRVETSILMSYALYTTDLYAERTFNLGTFHIGDFTSISFTGSGFRDKFLMPTLWTTLNRPLTINTLGERDTVYAGPADDTINGGSEDDEIWGNGGNDSLIGESGDDLLYGGTGTGTLDGGLGNDRLEGYYGNQTLVGGAGADHYITSGNGSVMVSPTKDEGDEFTIGSNDIVSGIKTARQTDDDLEMIGNLDARRTSTGVTINGPSLYGFQILGSFTRVPFLGGEKYIATSPVTIKTGSVSLPIPSNSVTPMEVTTSADNYLDAGHVSGISFGGLLNLSTNNANDPLGNILGTFGLSFGGLDSNIGIKLGKDLKSLNAPLNPSIPYFFIHRQLGGSLVKLGDTAANTGASAEFVLAIDLADPFVYAKVGSGVGGLSFGGSFKGYIPFTPKQTPSIFAPANGEILLKNATASYAQAGYEAAKTIDLVDTGNNGWAVYGAAKTAQRLVVQTVSKQSADEFTLLMRQNSSFTNHKIQRFRVYTTTDANPTAGNSAINWSPVIYYGLNTSRSDSTAVEVASGGQSYVQINGSKEKDDTYEINFTSHDRQAKNITGFMIEVLPGADGNLGFGANGNFVLNEIEVHGRTAKDDSGPQLYGNIYAEGNVSLTSLQLPLSVMGEVVIDLDANDDGSVLGIGGGNAGNIVRGKQSLAQILGAALNDVRMGANGQVNAEIDIGKSGIGVSVPLASATAIYKDRIFAFKGGTAQPFQGTALDFIKTNSMTAEGYISLDGDVGFRADMEPGKIGPFSLGGAAAKLEINNNGASFEAGYKAPIVNAYIGIGGSIDRNGLFEIYAGASASFDAGPLSIRGSMNFRMSNFRWNGTAKQSIGGIILQAGVDVYGSVSVISAGLRGTIEFGVGSGGLIFSGSGSVYGSWPNFDIGVRFDTSGFTIVTPDMLPNLTVRW